MADKAEAAACLQRIGAMLGPIIALADDLKNLGSLEQAEAETKSRLGDLQRQVSAKNVELDGVAKKFAEDGPKANALIESARKEAERILGQADTDWRAKANQIVVEAQMKSEAIITDAQKRADVIEPTLVEIEAAEAQLVKLETNIEERRTQLDILNANVSAMKSQIAALK